MFDIEIRWVGELQSFIDIYLELNDLKTCALGPTIRKEEEKHSLVTSD